MILRRIFLVTLAGLAGLFALQAQEKPAAPPTTNQPAPTKPAAKDQFGDDLPAGAIARMGTVRWRHGNAVVFIGFSRGGKEVVTACQDGIFHIWDAATGKELRRFSVPNAAVMTQVTNLGARMIRNQSTLARVALSADGLTLASAGHDGTLRLWDVQNGKELRQFKSAQFNGMSGLAFAPDGKTLASKSQNNAIQIWNVADGKELRQLNKQPANRAYVSSQANSLAYSGDGKLLASGTMEMEDNKWSSSVKIFEMDTGKELSQIKGQQFGVPGSLVFTADKKLVAWVGGDSMIHVNEVATGKELKQVGGPLRGGYLSSLLFLPDNKTLLSKGYQEEAVHFWDVTTGKETRQLGESGDNQAGALAMIYGYGYSSQLLALTADGKTLACGGLGNTVRLWDMATGKEHIAGGGHQGAVASLSVSPDSKTVFSWGYDGVVRQWEAETGKEQRNFRLPSGATTVAFSPDGRFVAYNMMPQTTAIWDLATGKELRQLRDKDPQAAMVFMPFGMANNLCFANDSQTLALRSWDGAAHLWNAASGKAMHTLSDPGSSTNPNMMLNYPYGGGFSAMAFSPNGMFLATVGPLFKPMVNDNNRAIMLQRQATSAVIRLWHVPTGRMLRQFDEQAQGIGVLAFSPDGHSIASGNFNNTISLWETATGKERGQIQAQGQVSCLAYSADGWSLLSSGPDQTIRQWDVRELRLTGQVKGHLGNITAVAFAPDGRRVFSASDDTTLLAWDRASLGKSERPPVIALDAKQLDECWNDLASTDAKKAASALWKMVQAPAQTMPYLRARLKPVPAVEEKRIEQLVADLDSNRFVVRQQAYRELAKLGELAAPSLKKAMGGELSLEMKRRIEQLEEEIVGGKALSADDLRQLRSSEVLERIGSPDARQVLEVLARGAPGAELTRDAQAAAERLARKNSATP
jgi:WD40 repeat protein